MKTIFTALTVFISCLMMLGCDQKNTTKADTTPKSQKIIFVMDSIEYVGGSASDDYFARNCKTACRMDANSENIDTYLSQNWRIISSTPKQVPVRAEHNSPCVCIGTQYVIEK